MKIKKKVNYLSNKRLLAEIQRSKLSYCEFTDPTKTEYDIVVNDLFDIPEDILITALKRYVKKFNKKHNGANKLYTDFSLYNLTVRLMTYAHIPLDPDWPENKEKVKPKDGYVRLNFPPFQHYVYVGKTPILVGLSHVTNKQFNPNNGRTTNELGKMYMTLVNKLSHKPNFSGYTYLDDMKGAAYLKLCLVGLTFTEGRQQFDNPFAYYTRIVINSFKNTLNKEKKHRDIRDDLLEDAGQLPSMTRQLEIR